MNKNKAPYYSDVYKNPALIKEREEAEIIEYGQFKKQHGRLQNSKSDWKRKVFLSISCKRFDKRKRCRTENT